MKSLFFAITLCFFTVLGNAQCNPTFLTACSNSNYIDSVYVLGQPISNSSACTGSLPNNLTVYNDTACWLLGFNYWHYVRTSDPNLFVATYIDYNGDNLFDPILEQVYNQKSNTRFHNGSIFLPISATKGIHKIRIITSTDSIQGPCDTLSNGEVEEYYCSINESNPYPINCNCPNSFNSINDTACNSMLSPGGNQLWTNSGLHTDTLINSNGCDSFLRVFLTIHSLNYSIHYDSMGLSAQEAGKTYQWIDCNTNQIIPGATNQSIAPTNLTSNVACIVSDANCSDTSDCKTLFALTAKDFNLPMLKLYPNPAIAQININSEHKMKSILLRNMQGQKLLVKKIEDKENYILNLSDIPNGIYILHIETSSGIRMKKLVIHK